MTAFEAYFKEIQGKKVGVIGVGISNLPLLRLLASHGAVVTAYDKKEDLGEVGQELADLGVHLCLGEGYLEHLSGALIFRTPGMHPENLYLRTARARGSQITSEMELFFQLCPTKRFAITGSDGKTTTTTLIYELLKQAGHRCHLGGNIGRPLLADVPQMKATDFSVVELSSFQLITMTQPNDVAVVTNVTPNHLDIHRDMAEYIQAKTNVFTHQAAGARLVLNADDPISQGFVPQSGVEVLWFSLEKPVESGVYLQGDCVYRSYGGKKEQVLKIDQIRLSGRHNIANYMAAICATMGYVSLSQIATVAEGFGGVAHRLEFVRELGGVKFYNDSIASSPSRTIAGLRAFKQKIILIAGGYDKNIPYDVMGADVVSAVKQLVLLGATGPKIKQSVLNCENYTDNCMEIYEINDFAAAVRFAASLAKSGDIVLLSPASASFDLFKNFEERGNVFKELVHNL